MFIYIIRSHEKLTKRAIEIFGEDLVEEGFIAIKFHEDREDSWAFRRVLFEAAEAGLHKSSEGSIGVDYGEQIVIKFKNGKEVLFETSEWMHITDREKFFKE